MADETGVMDAVEPLEQETPELETPETPEIEQEQQETPEDEKIDGRKLTDKKLQAALKAFRDASPENAALARSLKDDVGRMQAIRSIAPGGVTEIRAWKSAIDANGGIEGLAELSGRSAAYEATDAMLASGDPKVLDEFGEEFKDGLAKLAPAYLARVEKENPEAFAAAVGPHFAKALAATGLEPLLRNLYAKAGDNQEVKAGIKSMFDWYMGQINGAKASQGDDPLKADRDALQTQKSEFEKSQDKAFWDGLTTPLAKYETDAFTKHLNPYLKTLKLDKNATARLVSDFKQEMQDRANKDSAYIKQMNAYRAQKNRDPQKIQQYVQQSIDRMAKGVVDDTIKARYGSFLGQRKPATATNGNGNKPGVTTNVNGAPIRVVTKPLPGEVDWNAMKRNPDDIFKHIYKLKNGKTVQWTPQN